MKTKIASLVAIAMLSAPVMAQSVPTQTFEQQVFATQAPVHAVELSQTEMKETKGEYRHITAAIGAAGGAAGYLIKQQISGDEFSWKRLGFAAGAGAIAGATASPTKLIWGFNKNILRGSALGVAGNLMNKEK